MAKFKDFRNDVKPNWCPGCGHFSIQSAIQRASANSGLEPEDLALVSGIGCSGRVSGYIKSYGFHATHGRSLPIAQGIKMANDDLTVIASGGDGDGFAIGLGHTTHSIKRNIDMTYVVMDNQIYGLTKGQTSPSSAHGFVTNSTPEGSIESPIIPVRTAMASGATFVAQSVSSDIKGLTAILEAAIAHKGFAFVNVYSPCVTYNKVNTYEWFKEHVTDIDDIEGFDNKDRNSVMNYINEYEGLLKGILYQNNDMKSYGEQIEGYLDEPVVDHELKLDKDKFDQMMNQFA